MCIDSKNPAIMRLVRISGWLTGSPQAIHAHLLPNRTALTAAPLP
jgi:hypothetical protein